MFALLLLLGVGASSVVWLILLVEDVVLTWRRMS
jgi:hypothetical protein